MTLLFVASAFAMKFRTSCNEILYVNNDFYNSLSDQQAAQYLADLNYLACDVYPTHIMVYYSH